MTPLSAPTFHFTPLPRCVCVCVCVCVCIIYPFYSFAEVPKAYALYRHTHTPHTHAHTHTCVCVSIYIYTGSIEHLDLQSFFFFFFLLSRFLRRCGLGRVRQRILTCRFRGTTNLRFCSTFVPLIWPSSLILLLSPPLPLSSSASPPLCSPSSGSVTWSPTR